MFDFINNFLDMLLIPVSFLPESILSYLRVITSAFGLFFVGKILKWLWDLIPAV